MANCLFTPEMQVRPRLGSHVDNCSRPLTPPQGLCLSCCLCLECPPSHHLLHCPPVQIPPWSRTSSNISGSTKPPLTTLTRNNLFLLPLSSRRSVCILSGTGNIPHCVRATCWPPLVYTTPQDPWALELCHVPLWTLSPPWHLLVQSRHLVKISWMNKWLPQQWQKQKQLPHSWFLLLLADSPPPPSVAFKNIFTRSTNYPGEVWGLTDKCRQLYRPKKLPETLRMTREAQAREALGESESLVRWQLAPGEWKCYFLKELHLLWFMCASSSAEEKLQTLFLNTDSNNRLSNCRSSWGLIIHAPTYWTFENPYFLALNICWNP